jgi:hypothetical protein
MKSPANAFALLDTMVIKLDAALRDGSINAIFEGEKVPKEFWLESGLTLKDFLAEDLNSITFSGEDIMRVFPPHGDH